MGFRNYTNSSRNLSFYNTNHSLLLEREGVFMLEEAVTAEGNTEGEMLAVTKQADG